MHTVDMSIAVSAAIMPASFCYVQAYKASFIAALEAEHTEEWQLAEERLKTWPEQRLKVNTARYTCEAWTT